MREKRNARPAGGTAGAGQGENAACGRAAFSDVNFTTDSQKAQCIFDLLPQGEESAVSSEELTRLVGVSSKRELQSKIAMEREAGALILSTCRNGGGYYRPSPGEAGRAEIERYIATLRSRALSTLRVLRSAKAAVSNSELYGQLDLDDMEAW